MQICCTLPSAAIPSISSDVQTVRRLLQTCNSWRAAVQQCAAGNLRIRIHSNLAAEQQMKSMQKLARFGTWLKQHAGLVSSISFEGANMGWGYYEPGDAYCEAAEQLLALALQEAAAAAPQADAAAAAAPPAAAQMRTALQLRNCSIHCVWSSALLLALPPSVTHLDLTHRTGA
jgi:hypothetical protein